MSSDPWKRVGEKEKHSTKRFSVIQKSSSGIKTGSDIDEDEQAIIDAARMNGGASVIASPGHAEHMGSYRFNQPLQEDVHVQRNHPSILKAFSQNPYAQPLNAF